MRASHYAVAFVEAVRRAEVNEAILAENLVALLKRNHHESLLPRIVRHVERLLKKKLRQETITIIGALEAGAGEAEKLLKQEQFSEITRAPHTQVVKKTDLNIIGGFIVQNHTKRIDISYKKALHDIYLSITH